MTTDPLSRSFSVRHFRQLKTRMPRCHNCERKRFDIWHTSSKTILWEGVSEAEELGGGRNISRKPD